MPDVHWTAYPAAFGGFVAATAAVWIALRSTWRERRAQPKLALLYDHTEGEDFAAGVMEGTQHWVRLRVENGQAGRSGRRSADDVEVLVVEAAVRPLQVDPREGKNKKGLTWPLRQVEGCAFKWSNILDEEGRPLTRLTIPPGVARRFDLLAVQQPLVSDGGGGAVAVSDEGADGARGEWQIQPVPLDGSSRLGRAHHWLRVVLTARDTDAAYYDINLTFDGRWWGENTIREHLQVTVSSPKRVHWK